jgi:hypothetical protein
MKDRPANAAAMLRRMKADPMFFFENVRIRTKAGLPRFSDCMAPFQVRRFSAISPSLADVAAGRAPRVPRFWREGVKGIGKTSDSMLENLYLLLFSDVPPLIQVGAFDLGQAAEHRLSAAEWLRCNPWIADQIDVQNLQIVNRHTEARCEILPADRRGSHGSKPTVVVADELHASDEEFISNLFDNLDKMALGLGVVLTNAGIIDSWQYRWREMYRNSPRCHFDRVTEPADWSDPQARREAFLRNPRNRYLRLYECQWVPSTGDALDHGDLIAAITMPGPMSGRENGYQFICGIDIGILQDRSSICILAASQQTHRIRLAYVRSFTKGPNGRVDIEQVEREIINQNKKYNFRKLFYDPAQCEYLAERLHKAGIPVAPRYFAGRNLTEMASSVLEVTRSRRLDLYDDHQLIRDLGKLSIEETSFGYKLAAPRDKEGHADSAFAFAVALPECLKISGSFGAAAPTFIRRAFGVAAGTAAAPISLGAPRFGVLLDRRRYFNN